VSAMAVAMAGLFVNGQAPPQYAGLRAWMFALVAVGLGRMTLSFAQRWARARRLVGKSVLIMGAGVVGAQVARRLESHPEYGLTPVGFLDEDPPSVAEVGGRDLPVLGTIEDLEETVMRTGVRHLIVAFSSVADARVSRLIQHCQELGVEVSVVPRMFDTINNRVGYDTVGGLPLMSFTTVDPRGAQFAFKHALDRVIALVLLFVLAPVILCSALAVSLTSRGPVLFSQRRVGRDGKAFDLYKLRSMHLAPGQTDPSEDDAGPLEFLLGGDTAPGGVEGEDRRTAVGRLLRRCSLDELPQLLNVLRGEMSLIGPRPERPEFVELFRQDIVRYGDRHRVKSGITGWAQVHGLRGQTSLAERVEWDNYYIAHWSLGLDMKILALTIVALFRNAE
jgi:exopolysaccharide biosynthesis polyprenyl glycosylphosphotransferase